MSGLLRPDAPQGGVVLLRAAGGEQAAEFLALGAVDAEGFGDAAEREVGCSAGAGRPSGHPAVIPYM